MTRPPDGRRAGPALPELEPEDLPGTGKDADATPPTWLRGIVAAAGAIVAIGLGAEVLNLAGVLPWNFEGGGFLTAWTLAPGALATAYLIERRFDYATVARVFAASFWLVGVLMAVFVAPLLSGLLLIGLVWAPALALGSGLALLEAPGDRPARIDRMLVWSMIGAPLLFPIWSIVAGPAVFALVSLGTVVVATAVWLGVGRRLAPRILAAIFGRSEDRLVRLRDAGDPPGPPTMLRWALYPMLFAYVAGSLLAGPSSTTDPGARLGQVLVPAIVSVAVLAVVIVPWKWIFETLDIRFLDPVTGFTSTFRLPHLADEFIGIGAVATLLWDALGGLEGAVLDRAMEAFIAAGFIVWYLVPIAVIPTVLYVRQRLEEDVASMLETLDVQEVDHVSEAIGGRPEP